MNLSSNVKSAFDNIPEYLLMALNKTIKIAADGVNKLSSIFNKLTGTEIFGKVSAPTFKVGALKQYKDITAGLQDVSLTFSNTVGTLRSNAEEMKSFADKSIEDLAKLAEKGGTAMKESFDTKTLDGMGKAINSANKELAGLDKNSSAYLKKKKEIDKMNEDLKKMFASQVTGNIFKEDKNGGSKAKNEAEQKAIVEANKKALIEIQKINEDKTLSEEERAKKVLEINENLEDELNKIRGDDLKNEVDNAQKILKSLEDVKNKESKLYEKRKKNAEDYLELQKDAYEAVNDVISKEIDESKKKIKELEDQIEDAKDKIKGFTEELN
ncbi:MAG TPA: hypothetical protein PLQ36_04400, partial [Candidatus Gracilibacteria bacterium]|nr:hypothetical protein [Candidatus Gracilibacteria bacterium]